MPGTVLTLIEKKVTLWLFFYAFLCIFSYNVERIVNGGVDMKNKIVKLMEKEGFILFLFICVCVVAGGTLFISMRNLNLAQNKQMNKDLVIVESKDVGNLTLNEMDPREEYLSYQKEMQEEEADLRVSAMREDDLQLEEELAMKEEVAAAKEVVETEVAQAEVEEEEVELEFVEEEDVEVTKDVKQSMDWILPLEGPIITEFANDSLVYSKTLESWVGHKGIDIGAKEGTIVVASMDGVVERVYEDDLWGIVIVIDHGNKLKTRYSNLATKEMVKVGIRVKKGDRISKVGKTAKIEMLMEPHLHFEVIRNEEIIDPRSITD